MPCKFTISSLIFAAVSVSTLAGCSVLDRMFPDPAENYKTATTTPRLEVPPEMKTTTLSDALPVPDTASSLSEYTAARDRPEGQANGVLPAVKDIELKKDRDQLWLIVQADPEHVWPRAREFWLRQGYLILREDPTTGTLETDWAENRSRIPQGPIRRLIGRVFDSAYSASFRDKFRMRLERGEKPGTTEIFITHQGLEEELTGQPDEVQSTVWVPRPADPDAEAEKLKQLMVFLGVEPARADSLMGSTQPLPERASLLKTGQETATLVVHEEFSSAWRSVGIALDRIGFAVEDRNRSAGIYYVRYRDVLREQNKPGLLSKLAFWSKKGQPENRQFQIRLQGDGPDTRVVILNAEGEDERSSTAVRILNLLYEKLR